MASPPIAQLLSSLRSHGSAENREGMARFGIVSDKVFGVATPHITSLKNKIGKDHDLALKLWATGWYEARILAAFIDDPAQVTPKQMNAWAKEFDNWAITDGVCLHLFADTPHGPAMALKWIKRKPEFVKRAGFVMLAVRCVHDKKAPDDVFRSYLPLIVAHATDPRNGVKKGVNWLLRQIGKRNATLYEDAMRVAIDLSESEDPAARWIGKDAVREFNNAKVKARLLNTRGRR